MRQTASGSSTDVRDREDDGVKLEAGKQYLSRRGEHVLITAIEPEGRFPVRFVVLDGPYKGAGARDGSRLTIEGRFQLLEDGTSPEHWNDLVAEAREPAPAQPERFAPGARKHSSSSGG